MIDSPKVAADYYQKIADRIAVCFLVSGQLIYLTRSLQDTGLGVRKRVIKLLKSFYSITDDNKRRIDICTKLVLRMFDEDDTVKDLAVKSIEDLWFQTPIVSSLKSRSANGGSSADRSDLLAKVSIIMGVSANFKDRQSPLEDMLHKIMVDKEGADANVLHERYTEICEALIDGLVDATELPNFVCIINPFGDTAFNFPLCRLSSTAYGPSISLRQPIRPYYPDRMHRRYFHTSRMLPPYVTGIKNPVASTQYFLDRSMNKLRLTTCSRFFAPQSHTCRRLR